MSLRDPEKTRDGTGADGVENEKAFETGNDQLFRELISEFPADFVRLVMPDLAGRLDLTKLEFRLCEYFTDSPRGGRPRRPDLVGEAPTLADPTRKVTLHAEIERKFLKARVSRLLDYNRLIATREGRPVHTIGVYVRGGEAGVVRQVYRERSAGRLTNVLFYDSVGISRARAEEYLALPLPPAWAFAALMKPGVFVNRTALRFACLRRICGARHLTESQRYKLFNFVASCIESEQGLSEEYDRLIRRAEEVDKAMIDWGKKKQYEGYVKGREEGLRELRSLVTSLAAQRFGSVPPKLTRWISQMDSLQELARLAKRVFVVESPEDLMLREEPA